MNTVLDIIHNASWIELIISVYALCLALLIANMGRIANGARCFISLSILTYFLIGGLVSLEGQHDTGSFFLYWAIGGAIGQFTFAGAVLLGILGGLPGIVVTLLLGFFLCPLLWLRLVFSILWVSLAGAPKRSLAIILCVVAGGLYASAPSTIISNTIIRHIINRNYGDTTIFLRGGDTNITIIDEVTKVLRDAKEEGKQVCYAVTVEGYRPPQSDGRPVARYANQKVGEQTLILNVPYAAADLSACCGALDAGVTGAYPILILKRGANGKDCMLSELNPSQMRIVTNKYGAWAKPGLQIWPEVLGKLPESPQTYELRPGMDIFLIPAGLGNGETSDQSALAGQIRRLKVKGIHYADAEGNSHSLSASPFQKALEMIRPSES